MSIPVNDAVAIERAGEALITAINNGDMSSLADFFAPNAILMAPARPAVQGSSLIPFLRNMALQNEGLKLLSTEMEGIGAEAMRDTGTLSFRLKRQAGERLFYKYLMLWQKVGPDWKLSSMIWNRAPSNRRGQEGAGGDTDQM